MPELPEVEVTRAGLADRLVGAELLGLRMGKPLRWPLGIAPEALRGLRLGQMARRAKYLWLPLQAAPSTATPAGTATATVAVAAVAAEPATTSASAPDPSDAAGGGLLIHLGMSGSLGLTDGAAPAGPHDHAELRTSRGTLRLTDPRRFGAVIWSPGLDADPAAKLLAKLGPEPFDPTLTPERFHAGLQARRTAVKPALLSGDLVVGAGNIYASEALFRAGIDPRTRCDRLSRPRAARLLATVRETLAQAIGLGGTTLRDFRDVHGMSGAFQNAALVYGREGEACLRCGGTVRRIVQAQRATYFCPGCQRR